MAPRTKLTEIERSTLASTAAQRYRNGESWAQIAQDYDLTSTYVRRLSTAHHTINYRRWGQQAVADVALVRRLRDEGHTLNEIAEEIGCSRQAVRTALEAAGYTKPTRYPLTDSLPNAGRARADARSTRRVHPHLAHARALATCAAPKGAYSRRHVARSWTKGSPCRGCHEP